MRGDRSTRSFLCGLLALALIAAALAPPAGARLPRGFRDRVAHAGLEQPTSLAIARNGATFVTERRGTISRFDGLRDQTPTQVADLTDEVMAAGDRGLLSIALDPDYPRRPFLYVGYTHDAPMGGTAPFWGEPGVPYETCPPDDPYSGEVANCLVSSHVSRIHLDDAGLADSEEVLVEDWCQVFPSHSIGDLAFDSAGKLLVSGGEGASFTAADSGRIGSPPNACGDPPGEGGALRAQDLFTSGDPVGLDGSVARIDPATGAAASGSGALDQGNDHGIVAYGLRNPFRFAIRPGTDELWIGDVGWTRREEINRTTIGDPAVDFGWPCYEGEDRNSAYEELDNGICKRLYEKPELVTAPWFSYAQRLPVTRGDTCGAGTSAISGIAFDQSGGYRGRYRDALFFSDIARNCIWSFRTGGDGQPKRRSVRPFEAPAHTPVDLVSAKGGLYYPSIADGTIRRISFRR
jgi:glucose/arabinose dehydrogenase